MKKALTWIGTVIGTSAVLALIFGALERREEPRTIATTGECLTTAPRDKTAITLRVTTLDKSAATSMKMATAKIAEITEYLKTQNVQMQTTQFNSYEKTEWNREEQKSVTLGIETTIAVEVSANSIETIEKQLSKLDKYPFQITQININYDGTLFIPISKINALRRDLFEKLENEVCNLYKHGYKEISLSRKENLMKGDNVNLSFYTNNLKHLEIIEGVKRVYLEIPPKDDSLILSDENYNLNYSTWCALWASFFFKF